MSLKAAYIAVATTMGIAAAATPALADIESWFNKATRDYPINDAVIGLGKKYETFLYDMYGALEPHAAERTPMPGSPGESFSFFDVFYDYLYTGYARALKDLTPHSILNHNDYLYGPLDEKIEPCLGLAIAALHENYLHIIRQFLPSHDAFLSVPDADSSLTDMQAAIDSLRKTSEEELARETDPEKKHCGTPIASLTTSLRFTL